MRFSIRDVLWLTLVIGVAVGWWADRQRLLRNALEDWRAVHYENMLQTSEAQKWHVRAIELREELRALEIPRD